GITCTQQILSGVTAVVALSADGSTMYALAQLSNTQYAVLAFVPTGYDQNNLPTLSVQTRFTVPTPGGEAPKLVSEVNGDYYVGFAGAPAGSPGIWIFNGRALKEPPKTAQLPQSPQALLATNSTLYMLLADGSLGQLDPKQQYLPLSVSVRVPLNPSTPANYSISSPVPTPANTPSASAAPLSPTATPGAGTPTVAATAVPTASGTYFPKGLLLADPTQPMHVLVADSANDRIVRFISSTSGPGLGLGAQYVYNKQLSGAVSLALTADASRLHAFTWSNGQL